MFRVQLSFVPETGAPPASMPSQRMSITDRNRKTKTVIRQRWTQNSRYENVPLGI